MEIINTESFNGFTKVNTTVMGLVNFCKHLNLSIGHKRFSTNQKRAVVEITSQDFINTAKGKITMKPDSYKKNRKRHYVLDANYESTMELIEHQFGMKLFYKLCNTMYTGDGLNINTLFMDIVFEYIRTNIGAERTPETNEILDIANSINYNLTNRSVCPETKYSFSELIIFLFNFVKIAQITFDINLSNNEITMSIETSSNGVNNLYSVTTEII